MIQLFYTGALAPGTTQPDSAKSLGGYVSSSPLADDALNNLFSDITPLGMQYVGPETYGLALRNVDPLQAYSIRLGYVYPRPCSVRLEVAAVGLYDDGCGKLTMQPLANRRSRPQGAEFHHLEMRRATASICLTEGVAVFDSVRLFVGEDLVVNEVAERAMSPVEVVAFLALHLVDHLRFTAQVNIDNPDCIELTRNEPGIFTELLEFDTDGLGLAVPTPFRGGLDNSASLGNLAGKELLGLWFRRSLLAGAAEPIPANLLEKAPIGNRHTEKLDIFISYEPVVEPLPNPGP